MIKYCRLGILSFCLLFSCKVYTTVDFKEDGSGTTYIKLDYTSYVDLMNSTDSNINDSLLTKKKDYSYDILTGKNINDIRPVLDLLGIYAIQVKEVVNESLSIQFNFSDIGALQFALINLVKEIDMINSTHEDKIKNAMNSIYYTANRFRFLNYNPVQAEIERKTEFSKVESSTVPDSTYLSTLGFNNNDYDFTLNFGREIQKISHRNAVISDDKKTVHFTVGDIFNPSAKDILIITFK